MKFSSKSSPTIHILTGCTASGKTELALRWAEKNTAEIVSCDSLLFYRGMDIGTAKPSPEELRRVPHHLIDIADICESLDVAQYIRLARDAIDSIVQRERSVLVVGGSGFYLKAFFSAVSDAVIVPVEIRQRVAARLTSGGLPAIVADLNELNPDGVGSLDLANPRRVARALERCLATGKTVSQLKSEFTSLPGAFAEFPVQLCRLDRPSAEINQRIAVRIANMMNQGLIAEVVALESQGLRKNPSARRAIGYRETLDYLDGRLTLESLSDAIALNTRQLVKKQRTWFRTQLPEHRVVNGGDADVASLFAD